MFFNRFEPRCIVKCCGFHFRRVKFEVRLEHATSYTSYIYIYIVMSFLIALSFPFPLEREYSVRNLFISGLKMLVYKRRDLFDAESTIEIDGRRNAIFCGWTIIIIG